MLRACSHQHRHTQQTQQTKQTQQTQQHTRQTQQSQQTRQTQQTHVAEPANTAITADTADTANTAITADTADTANTADTVAKCDHSKNGKHTLSNTIKNFLYKYKIETQSACIRESVDSLCRDGADAQYMQYISKSRITSPQIR